MGSLAEADRAEAEGDILEEGRREAGRQSRRHHHRAEHRQVVAEDITESEEGAEDAGGVAELLGLVGGSGGYSNAHIL